MAKELDASVQLRAKLDAPVASAAVAWVVGTRVGKDDGPAVGTTKAWTETRAAAAAAHTSDMRDQAMIKF